MKNLLLLFIVLFASAKISAQDEAIFHHYLISPILVNPSAAGFFDAYQLQLDARVQWTGFTDSPKTFGALFNGPIGKSFGIGLGVLSEQAAQLNRIRIKTDYAFRFELSEDWKFAAGFSAEYQRMRLNNSVTNSPLYQPGDDILEEFLDGKGVFDATLGIYGTFMDNTFAGLTINNLVRNRLDEIVSTTNQQSFLQYYTFQLGHKIELFDLNVNLEPSLLIRQIRNAPFMVDLNLKAGFLDDQLIAGVSYRSLGALGILLGTKLSGFNLYYSYDVSFQRFQNYNFGSHEVTVLFSFKKKDGNKIRY